MSETKVLDHGYVKLIETWGSDERIIEAARMSTDKGFKGWGSRVCRNCGGPCEQPVTPECQPGRLCSPIEQPGDEKLLRYLWEHKHHTPFEMAGAVFEVQAPIFVFREWHRHRTQSYNELSARYVALPDLFYVPSLERLKGGLQSQKNKQGSVDGASTEVAQAWQDTIKAALATSRETYDALLAAGVSRELARIVIPVSQYSRMRASANLRNWLAFLTLRMEEHAQFEIRQFANAVHDQLLHAFPRTMELFDGKS